MTDLLTRLESAETGSRELDCEIAVLMDTVLPASEEVHYETRSVISWPESYPRYTSSVDAALTLVQSPWFVARMGESNAGWDVELADRDENNPSCQWAFADWRTLPLAIVIAALRAREKGEG